MFAHKNDHKRFRSECFFFQFYDYIVNPFHKAVTKCSRPSFSWYIIHANCIQSPCQGGNAHFAPLGMVLCSSSFQPAPHSSVIVITQKTLNHCDNTFSFLLSFLGNSLLSRIFFICGLTNTPALTFASGVLAKTARSLLPPYLKL